MKKKTTYSFLRFFQSGFFIILGFAFIVVLGVSYGRSAYQDYKIREEISALQAEIDDLEYQKLESLDVLSYVMSEDFVEDTARLELNLKRPSENVVIFYGDNKEDPLEKKDIDSSSYDSLTNPQKWWIYFTQKRT